MAYPSLAVKPRRPPDTGRSCSFSIDSRDPGSEDLGVRAASSVGWQMEVQILHKPVALL